MRFFKPFAACAISALAAACVSDDGGKSTASEAAGDPAAGLSYARQACASCHAITDGVERSPNPMAPAFETLANRPSMSRMTLSALLQTPHRTMPNLIVDPDRIDDLAAYLAILRDES